MDLLYTLLLKFYDVASGLTDIQILCFKSISNM